MITDITPLLGKVHNCDCLAFVKQLPDDCIDSGGADRGRKKPVKTFLKI